jgi:hypothetical protein
MSTTENASRQEREWDKLYDGIVAAMRAFGEQDYRGGRTT